MSMRKEELPMHASTFAQTDLKGTFTLDPIHAQHPPISLYLRLGQD